MVVDDAHVFPGFPTPVLTLLFFPKPLITFLTCFCRCERQKYAEKKVRLNRGSNSQPPGHESDTLTTEPLGYSLITKQLYSCICSVTSFTPHTWLKFYQAVVNHFEIVIFFFFSDLIHSMLVIPCVYI